METSTMQLTQTSTLVGPLERDGLAMIPDLLTPAQLRGMQSAFASRLKRLRWNDADGRHAWTATEQRPMAEVLLERFYHAVAAREAMEPSLEDARRAFAMLSASSR